MIAITSPYLSVRLDRLGSAVSEALLFLCSVEDGEISVNRAKQVRLFLQSASEEVFGEPR